MITGLLIWLLTKRIPEQEREQTVLIRELAEEHTRTIKQMVDDLKSERALDRQQAEKLADTMVSIMSESNRVIGRCISVLERKNDDASS